LAVTSEPEMLHGQSKGFKYSYYSLVST